MGEQPVRFSFWFPSNPFREAADFLAGLSSGKAAAPTFRDALATEYVTDAVLKSAASKQWETVKG